MKNIIAKAEGNYPFTFYIEKAQSSEENGMMYVTGIASTVNIDHDKERMAAVALTKMANIINEKSVPLRLEHQKEDSAIVGQVNKAWVDERNQLWVKAVLDPSNATSQILYRSLKEGVKLGLSVGGRVKSAAREFSEATGKMVKTFYDVVLDEVSVTQKPANYDAWLFAKSIISKGEDSSKYKDTNLYREFLFENPQLDYLQVFEKSIPGQEWKKVESQLTKNEAMDENTKDKETEKATDVDTETKPDAKDETAKSYVSQATFKEFEKTVADGFEKLASLFSKAMETETKPKEDAEKDAESDKKDTAETAAKGEEAMDTNNPDKAKEETEVAAKDGEDAKETETEAKAESESNSSDSSKPKEETKQYGGEYQMDTVKSAVRKIKDVLAKSGIDMTEKAEVKKSSVHPLDEFVGALTTAFESVVEKSQKDGKRILGLESSLHEAIKNSDELQKSIKEFLAIPGKKQSVSLGMPYMVTKEGRRYSLLAKEVGADIKKSADNKGKTFKDVYKTEYSSIKEEDSVM